MAELSVSETTTFRWSLEEDVAQYAAAKIPAIGIWRSKLSDTGLPRAVEQLSASALKVSHLFWAGGFTGNDGRSHRESIEDAAEAIRTANALRCPTVIVCTGPRAGHTINHARRLVQAALNELSPVAAEFGVTLALEPMHPGCAAEWTFLTSLGDTLDFVKSIARPNVKMVFDAYHLGFEPDLPSKLSDAAPHVALVQLADARRPPDGEQNRCLPGTGVLPLAEMVRSLRAGGYDGYYDIELFGEEIEANDYHHLLRHAVETFSKLLS